MHFRLSLIILYIINTNEIYLYPVYIPSSHVALQGGLLLFAMGPSGFIYQFLKKLHCAFIRKISFNLRPSFRSFPNDKYKKEVICHSILGTGHQIISAIGSICWAVTVVSLTVVGYGLQNYSWRYLHLTTGLIGINSLITYW
jgi:hypothetical protein